MKAAQKGHIRCQIESGPGQLEFAANLILHDSLAFNIKQRSKKKSKEMLLVRISALEQIPGKKNAWKFKGEGLDFIQDLVTMTGEYDLDTGTGWLELPDI